MGAACQTRVPHHGGPSDLDRNIVGYGWQTEPSLCDESETPELPKCGRHGGCTALAGKLRAQQKQSQRVLVEGSLDARVCTLTDISRSLTATLVLAWPSPTAGESPSHRRLSAAEGSTVKFGDVDPQAAWPEWQGQREGCRTESTISHHQARCPDLAACATCTCSGTGLAGCALQAHLARASTHSLAGCPVCDRTCCTGSRWTSDAWTAWYRALVLPEMVSVELLPNSPLVCCKARPDLNACPPSPLGQPI